MAKGARGGEWRNLKAGPPFNAMPVNAKQKQDRRSAYESLTIPLSQFLSRLLFFDLDDGIGLQIPARSGMDTSLKDKLQDIRRDLLVREVATTGPLDEQLHRFVGIRQAARRPAIRGRDLDAVMGRHFVVCHYQSFR
jgi:hypothetical protein